MSDTVIKVENLSKAGCPLGAIHHQTGERYTALRDVLANGVKNVASSVWRGASSRHATRHPPAASRHQPSERRQFGHEPRSDPL